MSIAFNRTKARVTNWYRVAEHRDGGDGAVVDLVRHGFSLKPAGFLRDFSREKLDQNIVIFSWPLGYAFNDGKDFSRENFVRNQSCV